MNAFDHVFVSSLRTKYSETYIKRTPNLADTKPGHEINVLYFFL